MPGAKNLFPPVATDVRAILLARDEGVLAKRSGLGRPQLLFLPKTGGAAACSEARRIPRKTKRNFFAIVVLAGKFVLIKPVHTPYVSK